MKSQDSQYRYFCGIGQGNTETAALQRARENGEMQARKSFGNLGGFGYQKTNAERVSSIESYSEKESDISRLDLIDEKASCKGQICEAYAWYRFSKKDWENENERLKSKAPDRKKKKSLVGAGTSESGILNLSVSPVSNADVYIDGVMMSEKNSDVRIYVKQGKRKLIVDHPNYELYEKNISISASNKEFPHHAVLKPAFISFNIDVANYAANAEVYLNGELKGETPKKMTLQINKDNQVVLKHPEMHDYVISLKARDMKRGEHIKRKVQMEEKPAYLSFSSDPKEADVYLDGRYAGATPFKKEVARGSHKYEIKKDGYLSRKGELLAVGGETKQETVWLEKNADFEYVEQTQEVQKIVEKKKSVIVPPVITGTDKNHRFTLQALKPSSPVYPRSANREERVAALMRWDYPDEMLRATSSFKNGVSDERAEECIQEAHRMDAKLKKEEENVGCVTAKGIFGEYCSEDARNEHIGKMMEKRKKLLASRLKKCEALRAQKTVRLYVKIFFDEELYETNVLPKLQAGLKAVSDDYSNETATFSCKKKGDLFRKLTPSCKPETDSLINKTIYWEKDEGFDKYNKKIIRKYDKDVLTLDNSVWLRTSLSEKEKQKMRVYETQLKKNSLFSKVPSTINRSVIVKLILNNGKEKTKKIHFRVKKFFTDKELRSHDTGVFFFPLIDDAMKTILRSVLFENVSVKDIKDVSLTLTDEQEA